jgi:hypothetical protein
MTDFSDKKTLVIAGLLIGCGMGGFVDGIVFHQILQFNNMLSARNFGQRQSKYVLGRTVSRRSLADDGNRNFFVMEGAAVKGTNRVVGKRIYRDAARRFRIV